MICKTDAICLRFSPVSETSRAVMWYTRDHGRIVTLIKGSQRPKGQFIGQYDSFASCELLFYHRNRERMFIARECSPVKPRNGFRAHWRACAGASYLCDLVIRATGIQDHHPQLYDLLDAALDELHEGGEEVSLPSLFWFELKLLEHLGLAPRIEACARCGRALEPAGGTVRMVPRAGGVVCASCMEKESGRGIGIRRDVLAVLGAWQKSRSVQLARSTRCTSVQATGASRCLGHFLRYHLDHRLPSRRIAFRLITRITDAAGTTPQIGLSGGKGHR